LAIIKNVVVQQRGVVEHLHDGGHADVLIGDSAETGSAQQYEGGTNHFAATREEML
jgi:hypothetical protein